MVLGYQAPLEFEKYVCGGTRKKIRKEEMKAKTSIDKYGKRMVVLMNK